MQKSIKQAVYHILEATDPSERRTQLVNRFLFLVIIISVLGVILETVGDLYLRYDTIFSAIELAAVAIFMVEYILRIWSCTISSRYRHPIMGRLRFAFRPMLIIDLLAILPTLLFIIDANFVAIRMLRLFRWLRIAKLTRHLDAMIALQKAIIKKRGELSVLLGFLGCLLVMSATVIYYAEHDAQPEVFSSIPSSMWWSVATLTTVGYGDAYPVTVLGKIVASFIAILGIGMFALPAGILGSSFMEEFAERKSQQQEKEKTVCPHCGKDLK